MHGNSPASDRDAIRKFLAFLEDRRALFDPSSPAEVEDHVISSIHMIRAECTTTVGTLSEKAPGVEYVRAIGAACRRFLDEPYPTFDDIMERRRDPYFERDEYHGRLRHGTHPAAFFTALGEFRGFVGAQIAMLWASMRSMFMVIWCVSYRRYWTSLIKRLVLDGAGSLHFPSSFEGSLAKQDRWCVG